MKARYQYRAFERNHHATGLGRADANITAAVSPSRFTGFGTIALLSPRAGGVFFCRPSANNHQPKE